MKTELAERLISNQAVERDLILYDTVHYPAEGRTQAFWFSEPLGSTVTLLRHGVPKTINKTYAETNLACSGVFPDHDMDIRSLSLLPIPGGETPLHVRTNDVIRLVESAMFQLILIDQPRLTLDLASLLPGWWDVQAFERAREWLENLPDNLWESFRFKLSDPIIIPAGVNFSARAYWMSPPWFQDGCDLRLRLSGFKRPWRRQSPA